MNKKKQKSETIYGSYSFSVCCFNHKIDFFFLVFGIDFVYNPLPDVK